MKNVDFIICSDIHYRENIPVARTDDYFHEQRNKIMFIKALQEKHGCPVLCAGDVFDKWRISPEFESWAIDYWPDKFITIPGQHDLPQHNILNFPKSSLHVLKVADKVTVINYDFERHYEDIDGLLISGFPWGAEPEKAPKGKRFKIALIHTLTVEDDSDFLVEMAGATPAKELMKLLSGYDLIVSGDNHKRFIRETEKQLLINPGSMMRMTADQYDHEPGVYLVNKNLEYEFVVFPFLKKEVISREHIEKKEKRDERIEAFVKRIDTDYSISLSFEENLEAFIAKNKTRKGVKDIIWEAVDG
ncbi:MAG: metallophosphoesterase family protein [Methanogenium sp.]